MCISTDADYWSDTETYPQGLPITVREAWHRDAWTREQDALATLAGETVTERPDPKVTHQLASYYTGEAL